MNRRTAAQMMMLGTLGAMAKSRSSAAADATASKPALDTGPTPASRVDHIAMLVYPKMTALDLIGPQYMFASLERCSGILAQLRPTGALCGTVIASPAPVSRPASISA